ncbi:hypothetical protein EDC56_2145 [Sinobacterium caligoides]|uniref:Uncharacterized protein n=1 Tax=Sinobacterium caligoides TaxID=933926 RepID=A0A3N2DPJ0_9GAMM|nr:hypothetical protein [Sinobacterium caligoides]ROS01700.1 hypothetical protein EDC56_2145 [Sinobacterium caligoides]
MNLLCIPIQVDALVASDVEPVVGASETFEKLPYQNINNIDVNSQQAFLSSTVARRAFNNMASLPKGVHFHWALPDALTKGNNHAGDLDMPEVPNRWLIQRIKTSDKTIKQWVVESDYLYPPHVTPERAVQIPEPNKRIKGMPPYRYLGRQLTLEQWQSDQAVNAKHEYVDKLTVLGWGTPYFSTLYTECYSVFGAYDDEISTADVADYEYRVYGWHSDINNDFVRKYLQPEQGGEAISQQALADDVASWCLPDDMPVANQAVYFGSVIFSSELSLNDNVAIGNSHLSFAKTSTEAVATFLSKNITTSEEDAIRIENQLQAALFSEAMAGENIDFVNRLKIARHKEGFTPVSSAITWCYTPFSSLLGATFPKDRKDEFKKAYENFCLDNQSTLDELNESLDQVDKSTQQLASLRQVLYCDWSKYMQCRYPVNPDAKIPDADLVRHMMEQKTLPSIEVLPSFIDEMTQQAEIQKQNLLSAFTLFCREQNVSENSELIEGVLLVSPGSRYWRAKEPSLMIEGDVAKPSTRHGADGKLDCQHHSITGYEGSEGGSSQEAIIDWLSNTLDTVTWSGASLTEWTSQPWNPLCVEWRLDLHAESEDELASTSHQANYKPDYITSRYRVPLNDNEFSLPGASVDYFYKKQQGIVIDDNPNVVYGRSLLTFKVKDQIRDKLDEALEHTSKVEADETSELITTLKAALAYIDDDKNHILTQQLNGFHENLLMYSEDTSLCVDDPLAFSAVASQDKNFSDRVNQALGNGFYKQPSLGHEFTPIKSGVTQLNGVRIIDSFGRFKDLDCSRVTQPQRDVIGNNMFTPPRILQPLRLAFRWKNHLEAVTQQQTPICGWINYNVFDETIVCYSAAGDCIGSINSDGEWNDQFGVKQSLSVIKDVKLKIFISKLLSFHPDNRLVNTGKNYLPLLKKAIQRAQENIEPDVENEQAQGFSIKPLAVVSAVLDLQLYGFSEINKSWSALSKDLATNKRSSRCYGDVKFPIKLGEYRNLDDGLVAYWQVNRNGALDKHGSFPQSDMQDVDGWIDGANFKPEEFDYIDSVDEEGVNNIEQSLNDEPIELLMLMDPKSVVHATTGIVPKKSLCLDPMLYVHSLEAMHERYFAAPLLTPQSTMSLPLTRQDTWSLQQINSDGEYEQTCSIPQVNKTEFIQAATYKEGDWQLLLDKSLLIPVKGTQGEKAYFISPAENILADIKDEWLRLEPLLMSCCAGGIVPPENVLPLSQRVCAIEGWIESVPNQDDA